MAKEGEIGEIKKIVDNDIVESTEKESHCNNKCSSSKTDCESCVTLKQELLSLFDEKEHLRKEHEACKLEMEKWKEVAHKQEQANIENVNKLDSITKEKDALIIEIERRKEEEKIEEVKWQRANLDFDRMKVLHEKVSKENVKIAETCKSEIKEILKQKLEADNRYHDLVNEREKYREKERILLNTFDLWRSQIELNTKKVDESSESRDINYECSKCVYEATTQADLREHDQNTHTQEEFKCDHCGHLVLSQSDLQGHLEAYHENLNTETIFMCTNCDEELRSKI